VRLDRRTARLVGEGLVMGARLLGMGEEGWSIGGSEVYYEEYEKNVGLMEVQVHCDEYEKKFGLMEVQVHCDE